MKNCQKCNIEFIPSKGLIKFCSLSCRNNRGPRTETDKKKISAGIKKRLLENPKSTWSQEKQTEFENIYKRISIKAIQRGEENLLNEDFSKLKFERIRKRVILEQNKSCNICGLIEWRGKCLIFELNHIDGNNQNNDRTNLEALCPNCHSQTDTWRGRNKKNQGFTGKKISNEDLLLSLLNHNWNMRQSLLQVGLAAKGGNYSRCHSLKRNYFESLQSYQSG